MSLDTATLTLSGSKVTADISSVLTGMTLNAASDTVAQMTLTASDANGTIAASPLAATGTTVTWRGEPWQVGAITTTWADDNTIEHAFDCRSTLARKLRRTYKTSAEKKVSPSQWVTARVLAAGGKATCQPSSKQGTIAQTSGTDPQSTLDVIANLASDLDWSWCEWGGRLWFGSRYWAWQGNAAGQRTWAITRGTGAGTDALSADLTLDDDTTTDAATGTIAVPYERGVLIRPWDRLTVSGHGRRDGIYLVESIAITADSFSPVSVTVAQPRLPRKKKGSST